MKSPLRLAVLVASACALLARASDWPQWRGPLQTAHVPSGEWVPTQLPAEPKKLWGIKTGEAYASPVVSGGRVFFMDNVNLKETLHAVDAATGAEQWRETIDDSTKDAQGPPGPRTTPTVDGDRVYAQSCRGELQCRSVEDGALLWRVNFKDFGAVFFGESGEASGASRHGNTGAPVPDGGKLIVLAGSKEGASVVALDKTTGKPLWKSQNDESAYPPAVIATVLGRRQYVVFTCEGVIGLDDTNGRLLWRFPIKTRYARHVTTPVIVDDILMVSSHEHGIFGIRIGKSGDAFSATQAWLLKDAAINFSSPVSVHGFLYGIGPQRNVICVDVKSGKVTWSQTGYLKGGGGSAHASFIVMGGNILMLTDGGELVMFKADPAIFQEIGRVQVCGQTWSSPAYADGKLYVRDGLRSGGNLMCFDLR